MAKAISAESAPRKKAPKERRMSMQAEQNISGYLMILPNLIGFAVFTVYGVVFSMVLSFTDWDLVKGFDAAKFVGLKNYTDMFKDTYTRASLVNNMWLLITVPVTLFLAMVFAAIMNRGIYGKAGARALFFLPYVTNTVAVSSVWKALYHPSKGPINMILKRMGFKNLPDWLGSSKTALFAVAIILIWQQLGYDILLYSGALQSVPIELYEAADIDGANSIVKFFKVTLPHIQPTTFLLTILGIISSLQMWTFVQIVTSGGPGMATYTMGLYIWRSAFKSHRAGYASALSWLLTAIVFVFTIIRSGYENRYNAE